jgi:RNA polymerase sigma-70 factor (ECF subfamily)
MTGGAPPDERFARLWTRAQPVVSSFVAALVPDFQEAEDIVQEVAVVLLQKMAQYDESRPFEAWALGVARREALARFRKKARRPLVWDTETACALADACEELAPEIESRLAVLRGCLEKIRGRGRELLRMRYEEGLKPSNIAEKIGLTAGSVRVVLSKVRSRLRECVTKRLASEGTSA